MRNKLLSSNYDAETGISTATIQNKYGIFTGKAKLNKDEDADIASKYAGCRYAEVRAEIKSLKAQLKEVNSQIKILKVYSNMLYAETANYCNEANKVLDNLFVQLAHRKNDILNAIEYDKNYIKNDAIARTKLLKDKSD